MAIMEPPAWLADTARAVKALIRECNGANRFRERATAWSRDSANLPKGTEESEFLPPLPLGPTWPLDARYAVLAAVHDRYAEKLAVPRIIPNDSAGLDHCDLALLSLLVVRLWEVHDDQRHVFDDCLAIVREDLESHAPKPRSKGKRSDVKSAVRRGRKIADALTVERDEEIAGEWERFRDDGGYKPDFAKDKKLKVSDLDRLLDRVASRNRRASDTN